MDLPQIYPDLLKIRGAEKLTLRTSPLIREETKLRHYQVQMVMHLLMLNKMVVGDDVGLGKTLELITAYCYYLEKNPGLHLIWLGPKNSLYQVAGEFNKFTQNISTYVVHGKQKADLKPGCQTGYMKKYKENATYCRVCDYKEDCLKQTLGLKGLSGSSNEEFRKFKYKEAKEKNTNVLILNYSIALMDYEAIIQTLKPYVVVFDEATAFKNFHSKTWAVCNELANNAEKAWAATATIIKNRLEEAYSIYRLLVPGLLGGITNFYNNFCIIHHQKIPGSKRRIPIVRGYKNLDTFKKAIDPYFLGRTAKQVGVELPLLVSKEISLEMTPIQEEKYLEALDGLLETDEGQIKTVTKLTSINYCQQIVNSPYLIGVEGNSCKEEELFNLLENEFLGEKIIFFTRFRKWIDRLAGIMTEKGMNPLRITGAEDALEREANRKKFQESPDHNIMLITTAGGQALNLQSARILIWGDLVLSYGDVLQIIGRLLRFGSVHKHVLSVHLICKDSIDEHIFKIVFPKKKLFEEVLGKRHEGILDFSAHPAENDLNNLFKSLLEDASKKKNKPLPTNM